MRPNMSSYTRYGCAAPLSAGLAVLTAVSIIAAVVAGIQRFDAVGQSRIAQSEEMAAEATNLFRLMLRLPCFSACKPTNALQHCKPEAH